MRLKATLIITILTVSVFFGITTVATAQSSEDAFVRVSWDHEQDVNDISHDYSRAKWIFGPQPNVTITYADNDTSISSNNYYIEPNVDLEVQIIVPHAFLGENNPLDVVQFWGIQLEGSPKGYFRLEANITASPVRWTARNLVYRAGSSNPFSGQVVELDVGACSYSNETDFYNFVFSIQFVAEDMSGIFWTGMQVIDVEGIPIAPSWLTRLQHSGFKTPPMGLETRINPREFSRPSFYMAEITNLGGDVIHYVDIDETFVFKLSTNNLLDDVFIPFSTVSYNTSHLTNVIFTRPKNPFNPNTDFWNWSEQSGLSLFLTYNGTTPEVKLGHENVTWVWKEVSRGISHWEPRFNVIVNTSVPLSDYYTIDLGNTVVENSGTTIKWAGALTEKVDLKPAAWEDGGVINPPVNKIFVSDVNGGELIPRVEIHKENTLSLAFKTNFVEAIITDGSGNIIRQADNDETLNATFKMHGPQEKLNGSYEYDWLLWRVRLNTTLQNATFRFKGSAFEFNETYFWFTQAKFKIVTDFETETSSSSALIKTDYYHWNFTMADTIVSDSSTAIDITAWDYEVESPTKSVLSFEFEFTDEVPALVIGTALFDLGLFQNYETKFLNLGDWVQDHNTTVIQPTWWAISWSPASFFLGTTNIWEPEVWTVTDEGAIDLDGNIFTTDDQYFVKRVGSWSDHGNVSHDTLSVSIFFDPSTNETGDEYWSRTWVGIRTLLIEFEASEKFYWYNTDDLTHPVSASEMDSIRNALWVDDAHTIPALGYKYVAWLTENKTVTLSDIPGVESDVFEVTWLGFGTNQVYNVAQSPTEATLAGFRAHYAGLLLFNDTGDMNGAPDFSIENRSVVTDEVTHFFLIDNVGSIEFRMPFGSSQDENITVIPLDEFTSVDFGASIYDVNGTLYPIHIEHSNGLRGAWQLRESAEGALGLNQTNFDYAIETATIDEMAFDVHFTIDQATYNPEDPETWNHKANLKVDHYIGEWTLHNFDNSILEGRSLAVNYFGVLGTATRYTADTTPVTDTNGGSVTGNTYSFANENGSLAEVQMGGLTYTWAGDAPPFSVDHDAGSSTAPIGAFSAMYESSSGADFTGWQVNAAMFFMSSGFSNWDGHAIDSDPVFVAYTSAYAGTPMGPTTHPTPPTGDGDGVGGLLFLVGGLIVVIVIIVTLRRRR